MIWITISKKISLNPPCIILNSIKLTTVDMYIVDAN